VFEDNGYSEHTGASYAVGSKDIAGRARGFGMPAEVCDGADFFSVHEAMGRAVERARAGGGPTTLEPKITRFFGHFEGDPMLYRARDEVARQRESMDCLKNFRARVTAEGWLAAADLDAIDRDVLALIEQSVASARSAAPPAAADLLTDVYVSY
jgi:acetoin:2,6-dichlorophenolindophenol oxidoreductase subunit alpha